MIEIEKLINETKKYLTKYDYDNVIKTCDKILKLEPDSSFALRFRSISYYKTGNFDEGLKGFKKLNLINPHNYDIIYTLAFLYEKTGNYNEALNLYQQIIESNKNYHMYEVQYKRKQLLLDLERYDTLIREYDEILTSRDDDKNKAMILGCMEEKAAVLYMDKQYEESYNLFQKINEYYPEVKKISTNPLNHSYWYEQLSYKLEESKDMNEFFENVFKCSDGMSWESRLKRNLSLADEYVFANLLIMENPENINLLEKYAEYAEYSFKDFALKCLYKILEVDEDNEYAVTLIIDIYSDTYYKDKALKFIDTKLKHSNLRLSLLKKKTELLESMTLYPEALEAYEQYIKYATKKDLKYSSMDVKRMICMELYALDLYNQNKFTESFNIFKKMSQIFKKMHNYNLINKEISWFTEILDDSIIKSDNNPEEFFHNFFNPDKKQNKIWIKKINSTSKRYETQKLIGNKTYTDILFDNNSNNYDLALSEARKYYYGILKPFEAIPVFNRLLKINPNNKEVLNQKFKMLIIAHQYDQAYKLLTKLDVDLPEISYAIESLADYFTETEKYEKAKNCLNIIMKEGWNYKTLKKLKYVLNESDDINAQQICPYYLEWINIINSKHDENICPICGEKLIPIRHGVIMAKDPKSRSGKYYSSETFNTLKNRPTDYCMTCQIERYMGFCGIELDETNYYIAWYTKRVLALLIKYLEKKPRTTMKEVEDILYDEFSINQEECEALLLKLELLGFIEYEHDCIKLWSGYKQFRDSINEMYHWTTNIFKNKQELKEYSANIKSKRYSNFQEYVEDIKIGLMDFYDYTYECATICVDWEYHESKSDLYGEDAYNTAVEMGFVGG